MLRATIQIKLKEGVVDPEGKNIAKALHLLHFKEVETATVSRVIDLVIDETNKEKAAQRAEEMCRRLLANPVINEYTISIHDVND